LQLIKQHLVHIPKDKSKPIKFYDREPFDRSVDRLRGKDAWMGLAPIERTRTIQQNRYLFGVVIEVLIAETEIFGGWESHNVYKHLERKFLNDYPIDEPREWVSIKHLSTVDFEKLMESIRQWASADLACYIPEPNEAIVFGEPILTGDSEH